MLTTKYIRRKYQVSMWIKDQGRSFRFAVRVTKSLPIIVECPIDETIFEPSLSPFFITHKHGPID